ncbi:hypothetical protein HUZ36_13235 [Pseudoalteromonas sp. McH1-7]|uniref:hypothetical protein n=1 Tax=unclassified Pseudoalteromonas TaxID=194690 RepID=UPI000FFF0BA9|nr:MULTISPECIES: hypothetical protein [unclassified Pseudoalteromonas]NUZ11744.1 hypothetical protein [Pseudoalteromonas sp. McH1-7]RXE99594.1 hypothetical protein D9603_16405 [Pseudoalteromonas sp. PS5]USD29472.1 hypothetical protein J8Z24_05145 [Pseudoalteromonas sp. SCSIO 43201]
MDINQFTPYQHYPLPHPENLLEQDVQRLINALHAIDGDIHQQQLASAQAQHDLNKRFNRLRLNQVLGESVLPI